MLDRAKRALAVQVKDEESVVDDEEIDTGVGAVAPVTPGSAQRGARKSALARAKGMCSSAWNSPSAGVRAPRTLPKFESTESTATSPGAPSTFMVDNSPVPTTPEQEAQPPAAPTLGQRLLGAISGFFRSLFGKRP